MNPMLDLELGDTAHRGAVAGQVILGVAVAAGLTPLAADRRARAVTSICDAVSGALRIEVRAGEGGQGVVAIHAQPGSWAVVPAGLIGALDAAVDGDVLEFVLARTPLRPAEVPAG